MVRVTNVRPPPTPAAPAAEEERLFAEEGPSGGCASGECLPDVEPEPEPEPTTHQGAPIHLASMAVSGRDNPRRPLQERWRAAVDTVRNASGRHAKSLAFGRLVWIREGEVAVAYPPGQGFHKATVAGGNGRTLIEKALSEHFARPTKLVVQDCAEADTSTSAGQISIAEQDAQERTAYEKSTEGRVRSHPSVRATLKLLGGEIEHIQVYDKPVRPLEVPTSESPDESP